MSKNYVKKHAGHDVPDGMAYFNEDNHCFYNEDRSEYIYAFVIAGGRQCVSDTMAADAAIELPEQEQDLPKWDDAPEWADRLIEIGADRMRVWTDCEQYMYVANREHYHFRSELRQNETRTFSEVGLIEMRPIAETVIPATETVFRNNKDTLGPYEVAPIAIEDKEWLPVVGEECLVNSGFDWGRCFIVGKTKLGNFAYQRKNEVDVKVMNKVENFRPLKTAEELEGESFHLSVIDACMGIHNDDFNIDEIASVLFDAGFSAPKGEG